MPALRRPRRAGAIGVDRADAGVTAGIGGRGLGWRVPGLNVIYRTFQDMRADPYGDGPPSSFTWGIEGDGQSDRVRRECPERWHIRPFGCLAAVLSLNSLPMMRGPVGDDIMALIRHRRGRRGMNFPPADAITARFQGSIPWSLCR